MPRKPKVESVMFKGIEIKTGQMFGNCDLVALDLSAFNSDDPWFLSEEGRQFRKEHSEWFIKQFQTPSPASQSESFQPVSSSLADEKPHPTKTRNDSSNDPGSSHKLGAVSPSRESKTALHGQAGEHLVMADLLLQGIRVHMAGPGCPYDLLAEVDHKFVRIQVKSTGLLTTTKTGGKTACYKWELRRGNNRNTSRHYSEFEYDIAALVATDIRQIAYLAKKDLAVNCIKLRLSGSSRDSQAIRQNIDQYPFTQALKDLQAA